MEGKNRFNKSSLLLLPLLVALVTMHEARAGSTLKQVQVTDGSQIDLIFDGKVGKGQIQTEFFNDVIQINLKDVSVYPAKISSISGSRLTKIFAYQYAPHLVRCRLTVKGKAESYKDILKISPNGRVLSLNLDGVSDKLSSHLASASREESGDAQAASQTANNEDERNLLERVMRPDEAPSGAAKVAAPKAAASKSNYTDSESKPLTLNSKPLGGARPLPSPWAALGKLALVVGIFLALALGVKKLRGGSLESNKGMSNALQRFAHGKLGNLGKLGKKEKMIEVVSTHYLGPKKSIAVVKIAGRMLVLGVSNESINLITQLSAGADPESELEEIAMQSLLGERSGPTAATARESRPSVSAATAAAAAVQGFSSVLSQESAKPAGSSNSNIRAKIRSRMEGMKPL